MQAFFTDINFSDLDIRPKQSSTTDLFHWNISLFNKDMFKSKSNNIYK